MTLTEYCRRFQVMSNEAKIGLLSLMVMALTVETRSAVIDLSDEQAVRVYRGFNELQHSIANQLCAYSFSKEDIRPDEIFWKILEEVSSRFHLSKNLLGAVAWAFSRD